MSSRPLRITLLASEWKSSKGGLSTMNRELAIQLAKHPNVSVSFFVPKCCDEDKKAASSHNVKILEAKERPGFEPNVWLAFPPKDLSTDFVVGHGVILGKQVQIIRDYHHDCKWVQVLHTAPDELAMYKGDSEAISKGEKKQWEELELCDMADLVVAVGPKLKEFYSAYLNSCGKRVYNFTPGIFTELSSLKLSSESGKKFRILLFGRGDPEDFELKGYDIAAQAVAKLNDKSYQLTFVGASKGRETEMVTKLQKYGLIKSQLVVKGYLENRKYLTALLCASSLVIIPSRTEGFGLTALEALSAGLPFLVSQNSGIGEALQDISLGSSFIVDSEDPEQWAEAIKRVRQKGSETAIQECQELRTQYAEKYSWNRQTRELLSIMLSSFNGDDLSKREEMSEYPPSKQMLPPRPITPPPIRPSESEASSRPSSLIPERPYTGERVQSTKTVVPVESRAHRISDQGARPKEKRSSNIETIKDLKGHLSKKEEMPEYQPPKQTLLTRPMTPQPERPLDSEASLKPYSFLPAERPYAERVQSNEPVVSVESRAHRIFSDQGARLKEKRSSRTETKDLVILGCSVSEEAIHVVMQEIKKIGPHLNLKKEPPVKNLLPSEIKQYLERNWLTFCVLVVDAESVQDAYENLPKRRDEYEDLLKTAVDRVAEKIIILVCDSLFLRQKDEEIIHQTIYRIVKERGKGFIAWLKNGKLTVGYDVLVQFLLRSKPTMGHMMPQSSRPEGSQGQANFLLFCTTESRQTYMDQPRGQVVHPLEPETRYGLENTKQPQGAIQQSNPPANTTFNRQNPSIGKLLLKSKLRYGRISYDKGDLEFRSPEFHGVEQATAQSLLENFGYISEIQVKIFSDPKDNTVLQVALGDFSNKKEGIQIADNETLVLKTRIHDGLISVHEDDIEFLYPGWRVPDHILEDLKRRVSNGKVYIIADEKGNLRCKVLSSIKVAAAKDKVVGFFSSNPSKKKSVIKSKDKET